MNIKQIKSGDILLVSSKGLIPKIIQKVQKCKYNHAGLLLTINKKVYVIEATEKGIVLTLLSHYTDNSDKYELLVLKPKVIPINSIIDIALSRLGTPYEFSNLVVHQLAKYIFGKWIGRKKKEASDKFICGEFVAWCWWKATNTSLFYNWYKIAPVDIYKSDKFTHHE